MRKWLLYVRISKKSFNSTLYEKHTLYMNPQISFRNSELKTGQADDNEGVYTTIPSRMLYSLDEKKTWRDLGWINKMSTDANAYIFCVYGVEFNRDNYDKSTNTYRHIIPWDVISEFACGDDTEVMVILNTSVMNKAFLAKAEELNLRSRIAPIQYDLEEKQADPNYIDEVMKDTFSVVFHKNKEHYEYQNEVRFAVVCNDKPDYYLMPLQFETDLITRRFSVVENADIVIDIHNLTFDESGDVLNFSSDIDFYYGFR